MLDVARTDPPMGTMMLGQSDDGFTSIDDDIRKVLSEITARSNTIVENTSAATGNETLSLAIGLLTCLVFSVAAIVFVSRSILKPITSITNAMQKVSTGDTEVTLNYRDRGDEIGQMIEAIQIFRHKELEIQTMQQSRHQAEQLQAHKRREEMSALAEDFDGSVKHIAGQLVEAVATVRDNAEIMAEAADDTRTKSGSTVQAVIATRENAETVAQAANVLSRTIDDLARRINEVFRLTNDTASRSQGASAELAKLAASVEQILPITDLNPRRPYRTTPIPATPAGSAITIGKSAGFSPLRIRPT